jgi:excisionase family DNA binding protein
VTGRLLTTREVGERYGHHPETILRWVRDGEMEGVAFRTPGGRLRFWADRLDAWEQERAATTRGSCQPPPQATALAVSYRASTTPNREGD